MAFIRPPVPPHFSPQVTHLWDSQGGALMGVVEWLTGWLGGVGLFLSTTGADEIESVREVDEVDDVGVEVGCTPGEATVEGALNVALLLTSCKMLSE